MGVQSTQPGSDEYQPRTAERLVEILRARSEVPRSIDREAAAMIEQLPALKSRVEQLTMALENVRRDIGQRLPDRLNAKHHLIEQIERALAPSLESRGDAT